MTFTILTAESHPLAAPSSPPPKTGFMEGVVQSGLGNLVVTW